MRLCRFHCVTCQPTVNGRDSKRGATHAGSSMEFDRGFLPVGGKVAGDEGVM